MLSYNEFWYERGNQMTDDRRTSLIVDPPDGRIPFTAATRARNAELGARNNSGFADSYEDRSLIDRCYPDELQPLERRKAPPRVDLALLDAGPGVGGENRHAGRGR